MSFSLNLPKGLTFNVNVTGLLTDPAVLAAIAALEKKMAETADEMVKAVKDAADEIIAAVKDASDRVATDVTELERQIAELKTGTPISQASLDALQTTAASLKAGSDSLKGLDPLPNFPPPVEPPAA